jgi:SAM-dependent methyltransferase
MARATGVPVVAIERDEAQISEALKQADAAGERDLLDLRRGEVESPPLRDGEWGTFDVAHARFVLEHVQDPLRVVRVMARSIRSGGRVILEDDDHDILRLWPEPPGFTELWQAYMRSYDRHGNDPIVGRRLVQLLHQAGVRPHRNTSVFFGSCAGQLNFPLFVANLVGVVESASGTLVSMGLTENTVRTGLARLREWGEREDAAIWFGMAWCSGTKP